MLVLSRKESESIVIGGDIVVTVIDIRGGKVRLGIEAPKEVPVNRREIHEAIRACEAPKAGAPCACRSLPRDFAG